MANYIIDLRKELIRHRYQINLLQRISCAKIENKKYKALLKKGEKLPDGVYQYFDSETGEPTNSFYTIYDAGSELSEDEKHEYIQYKMMEYIRTIKNCVVFFTVLTVVSLILTLILLLF